MENTYSAKTIMTGTASLFKRGQIWVWEDPIYNKKDYHTFVAYGEGTLRFNRLVLILQTQYTQNEMTVMVVPLSHSIYTSYDVSIDVIRQSGDVSKSHTRLNAMMPVRPKQLKQYICTVTDDVLKQIDAGIVRVLLDDNMPVDQIVETSSGDIADDYENEPVIDVEETAEAVKVSEGVQKDIVETAPEPVITGGRKLKWTESAKHELVELMEKEGLESVCTKYSLTEKSAKAYYQRYLREFQATFAAEKTERFIQMDQEIQIINKGVEKFAKMNINMFKGMNLYARLFKKYKNQSKNVYQKEAEAFYDEFRKYIISSINIFLHINIDNDGHFFFEQTDSKNDDMIFFLKTIVSDNALMAKQGGAKVAKAFAEKYNSCQMISVDYILSIRSHMGDYFKITKDNVSFVCNELERIYAKRIAVG